MRPLKVNGTFVRLLVCMNLEQDQCWSGDRKEGELLSICKR